jgi:hypothetical protein
VVGVHLVNERGGGSVGRCIIINHKDGIQKRTRRKGGCTTVWIVMSKGCDAHALVGVERSVEEELLD